MKILTTLNGIMEGSYAEKMMRSSHPLDAVSVFCFLINQTQGKVDSLDLYLTRHAHHVTKLETIMRMLDNNKLDVEQVS